MSEPVFVGLLFADRVITENNGKKTIVGTFNTFHSPQFPVQFPLWFIYAGVTNVEGKHTFSLNLVHEETQQVIVPFNGEFEANSVDSVVELIPGFNGVAFPREGNYTLTFNVDGELLGSRILLVKKINSPQK